MGAGRTGHAHAVNPLSTEDTAAPPEVTPEARRLLMLGLWSATLEGLKARLEGDEAGALTASFYDTVVGFLRDSGINTDTVTEAKEGLEDLKMAALVQSIKDVTDDTEPEYTPPKAPVKTSESAEVVPLNRPFEPRPPR